MSVTVDIGNCRLGLIVGDVTDQSVDAIVNAANSRLAGGGGVDGAIHRRGGPEIMQETNRRYPEGCETGSAVVSSAGALPAKHVIHAVGPVWREDDKNVAELLRSAYWSSLQLALSHDCQSIALPSLSTGAYGYPIEQASRIALETTFEFLSKNQTPKLVLFVLFDQQAFEVFRIALTERISDS